MSRLRPRHARHHQPERPLRGGRARHVSDDPPVVHHENSIRQGEDLVQLDRDQQERFAGVAQRHQAPVDELDRADVDSTGGLPDQEEIGIAVELAGQHDLLLIAARERRGGEDSAPRADVVLRHLTFPARCDRRAAQPDRAVVGGLVVIAEDGALARHERDDEAHAMAVLGHVGQAEAPQASRGARFRVDEAVGFQSDLPRFHRPDPRERFEQLRLPVAGDPRHSHDLATPHREADAFDALHPERVLDHEPGHLEHRVARPSGTPVDVQAHRAAHHQLGELLGRRPGGGKRGDDSPLPHHGDDVGDLEDLAQLVRDQQNGLALAAERREDPEEMVGLLGRQDGGRLVEDQEIRAPIERLQDLDALPLADAEIRDTRVGVDLEVVFAPKTLELGACPVHAGAEPEGAFDSQHDVFQDRERLDQHEVLMHHPDPRGQRVLRAADHRGPTADEDLAAIGLVVAVEDAHEGRLAGAVLAHDPVDRTPADDERYVAVGVDLAEPLVDTPQLDRRARGLDRSLRAAALPPQS